MEVIGFGDAGGMRRDDRHLVAKLELSAAAMAKLDEVSALDLGHPYDFMGKVGRGRW